MIWLSLLTSASLASDPLTVATKGAISGPSALLTEPAKLQEVGLQSSFIAGVGDSRTPIQGLGVLSNESATGLATIEISTQQQGGSTNVAGTVHTDRVVQTLISGGVGWAFGERDPTGISLLTALRLDRQSAEGEVEEAYYGANIQPYRGAGAAAEGGARGSHIHLELAAGGTRHLNGGSAGMTGFLAYDDRHESIDYQTGTFTRSDGFEALESISGANPTGTPTVSSASPVSMASGGYAGPGGGTPSPIHLGIGNLTSLTPGVRLRLDRGGEPNDPRLRLQGSAQGGPLWLEPDGWTMQQLYFDDPVDTREDWSLDGGWSLNSTAEIWFGGLEGPSTVRGGVVLAYSRASLDWRSELAVGDGDPALTLHRDRTRMFFAELPLGTHYPLGKGVSASGGLSGVLAWVQDEERSGRALADGGTSHSLQGDFRASIGLGWRGEAGWGFDTTWAGSTGTELSFPHLWLSWSRPQ